MRVPDRQEARSGRQYAAITRVYERRLLVVCGGDKAVLLRLVTEQAKASPGVPRHALMKQILERQSARKTH